MPGHRDGWSGKKETQLLQLQATTPAPRKQRRPKSGYRFETLDTAEAKRIMRLPFLPETAYTVLLNGTVLGIVVFHRIMKDWFADGCLSRTGLRHAFGSREKAAVGLRILAQKECRI